MLLVTYVPAPWACSANMRERVVHTVGCVRSEDIRPALRHTCRGPISNALEVAYMLHGPANLLLPDQLMYS